MNAAAALLVHPRRVPLTAIVARLDDVLTGSLALTIVAVGCVGAAMCDQAAAQALRLLGDQSFIGPEYIVLGFEEFGPLVVAVVLASRVGAGFAAEVATLQSEETLDALALYGEDPGARVLAPMLYACVIGGAALGLLATVFWEVAGALTMQLRYGINPLSFFRPDAVKLHSLVLCLVKNASFGALVYGAALHAGLAAQGGAEEVGAATTRGVVLGVIGCLAFDLLVNLAWFLGRGPA